MLHPDLSKHPNDWLRGFWAGQDLFICGGGPSALGFPWEKLAGRHCITLNDALLDVPNPDVHLFLDATWLAKMRRKDPKTGAYPLGFQWDPYAAPYKVLAGPSSTLHTRGSVHVFHELDGRISTHPGRLHSPLHAGSAALNAAVIGKAARVFLIGFDLKFQDDPRDPAKNQVISHYHSLRETHEHDGPKKYAGRGEWEKRYRDKLVIYERYYAFKNIYTFSNDTLLTGFPYVDYRDLLD